MFYLSANLQIIYHHQFLIHDLVFHEINKTMKPHVLHRVTFYKTNRYGKYSITAGAVESWNKIQKQLKNMLLKDPPPNKIKTVASNFNVNKSY